MTGPDVVVTAMLAGKKAANSIDRWLNGQDLRAGRELEGPYHTEYVVDTAGVLMQRQIPVPALEPADPRQNFRRGPHRLHAASKRSPRPNAASSAASAAIVISAQPPARPMRSTTRRKKRLAN